MSLTSELVGLQADTSLEEGVRRTYEWYLPAVFEGRDGDTAR